LTTEQYELDDSKIGQNSENDQSDDREMRELEEVADINPGSINDEGFNFEEIQYLDISSTGKGFIEELSDYGIEEAPSRAKRTVKTGDTVLSRVRPIRGQFTLVQDPPRNLVVSTGFAVLRAKEGIDEKYLYYAATTPEMIMWMDNHTSGSAYPAVNLGTLKHAEIPVPSVTTQKKIGEILHKIDLKIEVNKEINDILEEIAQALFKAWFVDFEFYEDLKQSELGEIPESFELVQIGDVCSTRGGGTPSTDNDEYWDGDNLWLTPKEVTSLDSKIVFDTERKVTDEGLNNSSTAIMPEKSVLLTSRATVGEVVVNREPMGTNQGFICIQPNIRVEPYYLACLVENKRPEIENRASGSTYDEISQTSFNGIQVAVPPKEDIEEFENKVEDIYEDIYTRELENRRLEELRDALLPKLMSGEIRVDNINLDELKLDSEF